MSKSKRVSEGRKISMKEYEFTCSECGQQISVNETMREAIVENGCPVCAATVGGSAFVEMVENES